MPLGDIHVEYFQIASHLEVARISADSLREKSQQLIFGREPNFSLLLNDGSILSIHVELLIENAYRFADRMTSGQLFDVSDYHPDAIRTFISFLYYGSMVVYVEDISYLLYVGNKLKLRICCEALSQYLAQMSTRSLYHTLCCAEILSMSSLYFCAEYSAKLQSNIIAVIERVNNLNLLYEMASIDGIKEILFAIQTFANEKRTRLSLMIANSWLQARNGERFIYAESVYALVPLKNLSIQELIKISTNSKQQLPKPLYMALLRQLKEAIYNLHLGIHIRHISSTLTIESQTSFQEAKPSPEVFDEILLPDRCAISSSTVAHPHEAVITNAKVNQFSTKQIPHVDMKSTPTTPTKSSSSIGSGSGYSSHRRKFLTPINETLLKVPTDTRVNSNFPTTIDNESTGILAKGQVIDGSTQQPSKMDKGLDRSAITHPRSTTSSGKQIDVKDDQEQHQEIKNLKATNVTKPADPRLLSTMQKVKRNDPHPKVKRNDPRLKVKHKTPSKRSHQKMRSKHNKSSNRRRKHRKKHHKYRRFSESLNLTQPIVSLKDPIVSLKDDHRTGQISLFKSFREKAGGSNKDQSHHCDARFSRSLADNRQSFNEDNIFKSNLSSNASNFSSIGFSSSTTTEKDFEATSASVSRENDTTLSIASNKQKQLPIVRAIATHSHDCLISTKPETDQLNSTPTKMPSSSTPLNGINNVSTVDTSDGIENNINTARPSSSSTDKVIRSAISASCHEDKSELKYLDTDNSADKKPIRTNRQLSDRSSLIIGDSEFVDVSQEWQKQPSMVQNVGNSRASLSTSSSALSLPKDSTNISDGLELANKANAQTIEQHQPPEGDNEQKDLREDYEIKQIDKISEPETTTKGVDMESAATEQNTEDDIKTAKIIQEINEKYKSSSDSSTSSTYESLSYSSSQDYSSSSSDEANSRDETSSLSESDDTADKRNNRGEIIDALQISDEGLESDESLKTVHTLSESEFLEKTTSGSVSI